MNCFVTVGGGCCRGCSEEENHFLAWQLDPVHPIWTKNGMDMVFDPKNKPTEDLLIFSKFKMAAFGQRSKIDQI